MGLLIFALVYLSIGVCVYTYVDADKELKTEVNTFVIITCWPLAILVVMYAICYLIGSKLVEKLGGE